MSTQSDDYTTRLVSREAAWWKRLLPVQVPYRWNLRRHDLGRTLDVGCGLGRNLATLPAGSVGVDHNAGSVAVARARGLDAWTVEEFEQGPSAVPGGFDALLVAHVLEHMDRGAARDLLEHYLPFVRPGGSVLLICPQERGFASDATHENFLPGEDLVALATEVGLRAPRWTSFPLPRWAGRWFVYNEFNVVARVP